ncbi:MAG: DNA methyltransferase [Candidatus Thorarchaeota archaeon]
MTSEGNHTPPIEYHQEFLGDISPDTTIPDKARILIISRDQSYLTHGIHKFPAKFFPELPRYLIQKYSAKRKVILDPMCGSGTVVLESLLAQRQAIGIDIDPMANLITRTKTTPIEQSLLKRVRQALQTKMQEIEGHQYDGVSIPEFHYRDNWFKPFVLQELGAIKESIAAISQLYDSRVVDFLHVIFSSIIRDVSNADPHCTRTVIRKNQVKRINVGDTTAKFFDALKSQIASMKELSEIVEDNDWIAPKLYMTSAIDTRLEDTSVDLAITSPPYINAVDYPRTHQLEMYWLDLINDAPLSEMKRKYIGTETVYKEEYSARQISNYHTLDSILERIFELDPRRSFIVYKFFEDMKAQLAETYRVLVPGGHYCLAVGSNLIRGVLVESHKILAEIASSDEIGFKLERSFFSGLIRHFIRIPRKERMHGEWVLILQKPP